MMTSLQATLRGRTFILRTTGDILNRGTICLRSLDFEPLYNVFLEPIQDRHANLAYHHAKHDPPVLLRPNQRQFQNFELEEAPQSSKCCRRCSFFSERARSNSKHSDLIVGSTNDVTEAMNQRKKMEQRCDRSKNQKRLRKIHQRNLNTSFKKRRLRQRRKTARRYDFDRSEK